ncbi:Protein CBG11786 [Caenorhabditis briggsae]|uniref:Protein CBG11786 n=1 Tax=Caenorhabditis briggsae TaxID=6238 RepID=A8XDZ5_CAEBR|nr:Protein CBG11786 [Caenorhabditis briggsae]CAP30801.2 Protein CBG11786 [Caenorhabditis briggsae]
MPAGSNTEGINNLELESLKCSDVRWFFKNREGESEAFNGNDSLILEIMYRFANGKNLDPEALSIYDKYLSKFYFQKKKESSGTSNDQEFKLPPLILNHLYEISEDLKTISPVFWSGTPISIERVVYVTLDDKMIERKLQRKLEMRQEKVQVANYPHEEIIKIRRGSKKRSVQVTWRSRNQLTIQREGDKRTTVLKHYREKATWNENHSKVDHLVFVVHGIWNNGNVQSVVDGAQGLNKGVNSHTANQSCIVFMPIHWRTNLYVDTESHKCPSVNWVNIENCTKDLKMYNCKQCGPMVKQKVIDEINRLYTKFLCYHRQFNGRISLFGHSLGSVICYDILSEKSLTDQLKFEKSVDKLFVVGSPLWRYLKRRGEAALEKFRETAEHLPIYNIYHPNDPVSGRLEEVLDPFYKDTSPIGIPKSTERDIWNCIIMGWSQEREIRFNKNMLQAIGETGHDLLLIAHTIYWTHKNVFKTLDYIFRQENRPQVDPKMPETPVNQAEETGMEILKVPGNKWVQESEIVSVESSDSEECGDGEESSDSEDSEDDEFRETESVSRNVPRMPISSNDDNIERPDPPVEPATEGISNLVIAEGAPVSRTCQECQSILIMIISSVQTLQSNQRISNLVIAEGAPFHLKLKNLKCSEVRWFFKSRMGKLVAFNGNDSLILEIMYRFANGQSLDTDAQLIHDKYLNEFYFRKKESSGTPNDAQQPKPPPLILNHLYKASDDLKTISPAFWKGEPISIERGAYLTLTDEIIEQKLAMVLQELQDEVRVGTYPHEENIEIETESGSIEKVHVVWCSPTYLVTHREDGKTRTLIKIKEKVIEEFNSLYDKFSSYHKDFKGCVSLFGHSLGSVICYDILTEKPKLDSKKDTKKKPKVKLPKLDKSVDKLFTVGSPLWFFFEMAGEWNYLHSHTIYWRHDSVFRLLDFIFTQEKRSQVEIKNPENEESQEENQVKIGSENLGNNEGDQPTTSDPRKGQIEKTENQAETQKVTSGKKSDFWKNFRKFRKF